MDLKILMVIVLFLITFIYYVTFSYYDQFAATDGDYIALTSGDDQLAYGDRPASKDFIKRETQAILDQLAIPPGSRGDRNRSSNVTNVDGQSGKSIKIKGVTSMTRSASRARDGEEDGLSGSPLSESTSPISAIKGVASLAQQALLSESTSPISAIKGVASLAQQALPSLSRQMVDDLIVKADAHQIQEESAMPNIARMVEETGPGLRRDQLLLRQLAEEGEEDGMYPLAITGEETEDVGRTLAAIGEEMEESNDPLAVTSQEEEEGGESEDLYYCCPPKDMLPTVDDDSRKPYPINLRGLYVIKDASSHFALSVVKHPHEPLKDKMNVRMSDLKTINCNVNNRTCIFRFVERSPGVYSIDTADGKGRLAMWNKHVAGLHNKHPIYINTSPYSGCKGQGLARDCLFRLIENPNGTVRLEAADGTGILSFWDSDIWKTIPNFYSVNHLPLYMFTGPKRCCIKDNCEFTLKIMEMIDDPIQSDVSEEEEVDSDPDADGDNMQTRFRKKMDETLPQDSGPWTQYFYRDSKDWVFRKRHGSTEAVSSGTRPCRS
jgi:hypothetical protein